MQTIWFEGQVFTEVMCENALGQKYPAPVYLQFFNNGILSVTMGNEEFVPTETDLDQLSEYIQGIAKAMGIEEDQVFVGSYRGQIAK